MYSQTGGSLTHNAKHHASGRRKRYLNTATILQGHRHRTRQTRTKGQNFNFTGVLSPQRVIYPPRHKSAFIWRFSWQKSQPSRPATPSGIKANQSGGRHGTGYKQESYLSTISDCVQNQQYTDINTNAYTTKFVSHVSMSVHFQRFTTARQPAPPPRRPVKLFSIFCVCPCFQRDIFSKTMSI